MTPLVGTKVICVDAPPRSRPPNGALPSPLVVWGCLIPFIPAVAFLRTNPASLVSKVAPPQLRGEALGLLDAASSVSRIVTPLLTGLLVQRYGTTAPFWLQCSLSLTGVAMLAACAGVGVEPRTKAD